MITKKDLRELIDQKLKDTEVLIANRRYSTAVYIAGYALELALKLKICKIFKFAQGFPEDKLEFGAYQTSFKHQKLLANAITKIKDIRTHDLNKLLFYSGTEYKTKLNHPNEWSLVVNWDPEMRYRLRKVLKAEATDKLTALRTLLQNIL